MRRSTHNKTRHISVKSQKGTERKALHKLDVCEAKYALQNVTNTSVQTQKGAKGKALHKPGVYEARHAKHKNTRVRNSKGNRGASIAQTRSLRGEVCTTKRDT